VRRVSAADRDVILEWANDPTTRSNSFTPDAISSAEHERWFARRLADPDTRIWILESRSGVPVAQVRYERAGSAAEIGISVSPAERGKGHGTAILIATAELAIRELGVRELVALVLPGNPASMRIFEKAGYRPDGESTRNGKRAVRLKRTVE
jgi:RimJ/RimL family protein N-acetyltransferase